MRIIEKELTMKTFSIRRLAVLVVLLSGCTTVLNRFQPFADYVGQEITLKRPCVLEEYIANNEGILYTFWENDQPTDFVYDDRMWTKPAKTAVNDYRQERNLYPAADYPKRIYYLSESAIFAEMHCPSCGGPYRVHPLPVGTKIFIEKVTNFNGIDAISKSAHGRITIPDALTEVNFIYHFHYGPSARGTLSDYIARAPWENESAPDEWFVGWTGTEYGKNKNTK